MRHCYGIWGILLCLTLSLFGCTSPTDVDATRQRTIVEAPPDILRFATLPLGINFGSVRQFTTKEMLLLCSNNSNEIITVTSIELKHGKRGFSIPPVNVPMQVNPNIAGALLCPITFSAEQAGEFSDTIILNKSEKYAIPLYANVRQLSVRTSDIDFGDVKIEQQKTINVVIENLDTVPVTIQGVNNNDVEFAYYIAPIQSFQLQPGEKKSFPVIFTPSKVKNYATVLRFTVLGATNDVDDEAILTGAGIVE